jgi:hypothetical protein
MAAWLWENFHSSDFKVDDLVTRQMAYLGEVVDYRKAEAESYAKEGWAWVDEFLRGSEL